ncbi:MAG: hypothetical protein J0H09_13240 [Burkholderiales bacterium]|nr:hypothetical protein [Burkholderiales bacterium]
MTSLILASLAFARLQSLLPDHELRRQLFYAAARVAVPIGFVLVLLLAGAPDGAVPLAAVH